MNTTNKQIEKIVDKVLDSSGIKSAPISLKTIADTYCVKIKSAPSKDFSGLLLRKDGVSYIGFNSKESEVRQRFTVAHEFGHLFLHKKEDTFLDHINYRDNSYGTGIRRDKQEIEANMFAASLLIPIKFLTKDLKDMQIGELNDDAIVGLAKKYQVSKEAMTYRLLNLGLEKTFTL